MSRAVRHRIGRSAFLLGLLFIIWLPMGIFDIVPFVMQLPGESGIRVHAAAAVACLIVAAWGFWNE